MKYPAIPATVETLGGTVDVIIVPKLVNSANEPCWGLWDPVARSITLERRPPRVMWATYYHELCHAMLDDSGIANLFSDDMKEVLCDALATARFRERFG